MNVRTLIVIVAVTVLLASAAAYTVFALVGAPLGSDGPGLNLFSRNSDVPGPMYETGEMTVNLLANNQPSTRYVRTNIVIELDSDKTLQTVEQRTAQFRDRIISIIRQETVSSISGSEGQEALAQTLMATLNNLLPEGEIVSVYFVDLVVQ